MSASSADVWHAALATAAAHGVHPRLVACADARAETAAVAAWLRERHDDGAGWRDLVVAAPGKRNWRDPLAAALAAAGVPQRMLLGEPGLAPDPDVDAVHVMTLHAAAERGRPVAAVAGLGDLPWKRQTLDEVVALLAAVTTNAAHALALFHSKPSALVALVTGRD